MAREYSNYQKKVIDRYYDHLDGIKLEKLQELITELYLAETDAKRDRLWERVAKAMTTLKIPESIANHILSRRDAAVLARNVRDWLDAAGKRGKRPGK